MQKLNRAEVEIVLASGSSLAESDLSETNLSGIDFSAVDMSSCDVRYADLTGAVLDSVNLSHSPRTPACSKIKRRKVS
ncbi:MAG TPA: hypothetical protein EYN92_02745 [Dehalococcoidia bacterium]|nr:hypothetical protein [Dehalococcoidia bacterium]